MNPLMAVVDVELLAYLLERELHEPAVYSNRCVVHPGIDPAERPDGGRGDRFDHARVRYVGDHVDGAPAEASNLGDRFAQVVFVARPT